MLLHGKMEYSEVNGPGNRACLWFAGCSLACTGCHNPDSHKFDMNKYVPNQDIKNWLLQREGIEGVTFSGGEPMQHAADLLDLIDFIKDVRPELSIGMFTGYTQKELETGHWVLMHPAGMIMLNGSGELWTKIAEKLDFAVMGRFNASKVTTEKPLCGSSNQDIVCFSDRYTSKDFKPQRTQVTINGDGLIKISGYPGVEFIEAVTKG